MRHTWNLVILTAVAVVAAGSAAAASANVRLLHPGNVVRFGGTVIYCTNSRVGVTASLVFLEPGRQVHLSGSTFRCVKPVVITTVPTKTTTTPTATTGPVGSSRTSPVPLGSSAPIGNGWTLRITAVNTDAWPAIQAANQFNDPPPAGRQEVLVAISATYKGTGSSRFDSGFTLRLVGASNVAYTNFSNGCGVMPDPNLSLNDPDTFTGGTISGNGACFQVAAADAGTAELYTNGGVGVPPVWFALR